MRYTFETAMRWLREGLKVRHEDWHESFYIKKDGDVVRTFYKDANNADGEVYDDFKVLQLDELLDEKWEIAE